MHFGYEVYAGTPVKVDKGTAKKPQTVTVDGRAFSFTGVVVAGTIDTTFAEMDGLWAKTNE